MPGYDLKILDAEGGDVAAGEMGEIALKLPLPPGAAVTLWNANDRFQESYLSRYAGYFNTADAGYLDEDGYVWVLGRTDDVINVAGPSSLDRRDGGGDRVARRRRRVRRRRLQGRAQERIAVRPDRHDPI
jgi:hypothetical protein